MGRGEGEVRGGGRAVGGEADGRVEVEGDEGGVSMEAETESPRESLEVENQLSWWALISPNTSASPPSRKSRRGEMSKE